MSLISEWEATRPKCQVCATALPEELDTHSGVWGDGPCIFCIKAEFMSITMAEGTSIWFPKTTKFHGTNLVDVSLIKYVEITPELAERCRYYGQLVHVPDEGHIAVFLDPVSGKFYGQPA